MKQLIDWIRRQQDKRRRNTHRRPQYARERYFAARPVSYTLAEVKG